MGALDISFTRGEEPTALPNPYGLTDDEIRLSAQLRRGGAEAEIRAQLGIDIETFKRLETGLMDKLRARSDAQLRHLLQVLTTERPDRSQVVYLDDFRVADVLREPESDVVFASDSGTGSGPDVAEPRTRWLTTLCGFFHIRPRGAARPTSGL